MTCATAPGNPRDDERVILVDQEDCDIGSMEKQQAHVTGRLHRAFSIFVFRSDGAVLLQRRAAAKYHSGGLWTNTCCSHPRPGETIARAAHRRLMEEMGFDCVLHPVWAFVYHADVGNGLLEHEYDHVLFGNADVTPTPHAGEVDGVRWVSLAELWLEMERSPELFTAWLRIALKQFPLRLLAEADLIVSAAATLAGGARFAPPRAVVQRH